MPVSWAPLFGSLFCLVVVFCCVLTSLVPNHLQEDLRAERNRFWGYTSSILAVSSSQEASRLRQDPLSASTSGPLTEAECIDTALSCTEWAAAGECEQSQAFMHKHCSKSCGLCQSLSPPIFQSMQVKLASGYDMPRVGFGTAGLGAATEQLVTSALKAGYRLIDTAQAREWYREDLAGMGVADSGVPRHDIFLTSKLHPRDFAQVANKIEETLSIFNTTYLDLFLLHYPRCWEALCGNSSSNSTWKSAYRELEDLVKQGKLRSIGVSNFDMQELAKLLEMADIKPSVVQSFSDIFHAASDLQAYCRANGIQFQAYSSLGTQWVMRGRKTNPVLDDPAVRKVAAAHKTSAARAVLRWALQNGQAVIPRSSNKERMAENLKVTEGPQLSDEEMQLLNALDGTLTDLML